jgi:hypothetical protein
MFSLRFRGSMREYFRGILSPLRGKVEAGVLVADREPWFATGRERMIAGRLSAFPPPLNGERYTLI